VRLETGITTANLLLPTIPTCGKSASCVTITQRVTTRSKVLALLLFALLLAPSPARAEVALEYFQGTAFNMPTTLTVVQAGYPTIEFTGHYEVRPSDDRLYYAFRVELWRNDKAWIIELLHHKMYLANPQGDVQDFEVTHGYNLITVNRGWRRGHYILLFGGGVVLGYPHSTIRDQTWPTDAGYYLSGVTIQGAAARRFNLVKHVFVSVEGKLTASWAQVPVLNGHATVPNAAAHVLFGLGGEF